jgi:hypothetical protein
MPEQNAFAELEKFLIVDHRKSQFASSMKKAWWIGLVDMCSCDTL